MKKIAIYSEVENGTLNDTAYELLSKAYELKLFAKNQTSEDLEITAAAVSSSLNEESVKKAFAAGADKVVLIKNDNFMLFNQVTYANAFLTYLNSDSQDFILFPATLTGRMVAPRVTTKLNTGLVADCTSINFIVSDGQLKLGATRPTFGAELMATILCKKTPECATVRPKTFGAVFENKKIGKYINFLYSNPESDSLKLLDFSKAEAKKASFENSKIIFAAGFGLYDGADNEYIDKLYQITKELEIDFGVSRKLVDYGIKPFDYQIGQTGSTVTPDLYVAFGISGAIQHISGMKNSKKIIAINSDENAEIFKYSDYKIVDDAKKIIDDMIEIIMSSKM